MKVLWCRLFGHKWKVWTHIKSVLEPVNGVWAIERRVVDYGYWAERRHCLRCGEVNPMFGNIHENPELVK